MFKRLATACCASGLILATTAFSSSDESSGKVKIEGGAQATTRPSPSAADSFNHEPGTALGVLPRDPKAERSSIDLTKYYTLALDEDASGALGFTLFVLPRGIQTLGNVKYDLRGIVQVSSSQFVAAGKVFPQAVKGIRVDLKCRTLCLLHASRWTAFHRMPYSVGTGISAALPFFRGNVDSLPDNLEAIVATGDLQGMVRDNTNLAGWPSVRHAVEAAEPCVVFRGHDHWPNLIAALRNGTQVVNVEGAVLVLRRAHTP